MIQIRTYSVERITSTIKDPFEKAVYADCKNVASITVILPEKYFSDTQRQNQISKS